MAEPDRRRGHRPPRPAARRRRRAGGATELIERFELDPHKKARTYSKGNRQKVALVAAFASDAELLLLDEPTSRARSVDGEGFSATASREVADRGAAVLLSSHILAEVEELCDHVTIIRSGRTVQSGTLPSCAT